MRLINVEMLMLEEFYADIPQYAILSHCWGEEEVTFKDWQNPFVPLQNKKGFTQIARACEEAKSQGCSYLWCDTNCIDKSSSSELSEAINSMFDWYARSTTCLAYLADVSAPRSSGQQFQDELRASRWFTRGWTVQELLAPHEVRFYDKDWRFLDSPSALAEEYLTRATGIDPLYLKRVGPTGPFIIGLYQDPSEEIRNKLHRASVAMRMSWLSKRETTRVEDMAYCMLGIFDINMPLLYGEGTNAFQRLQEEIIRMTNDMTIFCWHWDDSLVSESWGSILAPSPGVFKDSGAYEECPLSFRFDDLGKVTHYSFTNAGLSLRL